MSIFWVYYRIPVMQGITIEGNWMKHIQDVSVLFLITVSESKLSQHKFILKT